MYRLFSRLVERGANQPVFKKDADALAAELTRLTEMQVYPRSIAVAAGSLLFLGKGPRGKMLAILFKESRPSLANFSGQVTHLSEGKVCLQLCPTDHSNADVLRQLLPYTAPRVLGLRRSVGCGDRLGLATPGHGFRTHISAAILS